MVFSDFNLLQAYALRSIEVCQLHERLSSLEGEIARLKEMIKAQQDALFGKKSEASKSINPPQGSQEPEKSGEDTPDSNTPAGTTKFRTAPLATYDDVVSEVGVATTSPDGGAAALTPFVVTIAATR